MLSYLKVLSLKILSLSRLYIIKYKSKNMGGWIIISSTEVDWSNELKNVNILERINP